MANADDSDDEVYDDSSIFYADRPEWKDVIPVEQDDGPNPVVAIAYSDRFKDVFDYFRAVLRSEEKSERVFALTTDAVNLNPGNYTVWHYRRLVLQHLKMDLKEELAFCRGMIEEHPKNYQVWNHRRILVELLNDPQHEMRFVEIILARDAKNYHAWQHRQWALKTFKLWDGEMEFVDRLLEEDIRNNSAWNQRHFVVVNTTSYTPEVLAAEVEYAKTAIKKAVHNESPWNYLRGILMQELDQSESPMYRYPGIQEFVSELMAAEKDLKTLQEKSSYLHSFRVDLAENELENGVWSTSGDLEFAAKREKLTEATSICQSLVEIDPIRTNYWNYFKASLLSRFGDSSKDGGAGGDARCKDPPID